MFRTGSGASPAVAKRPCVIVNVAREVVPRRALADDGELDLTQRRAIATGIAAVRTAIGHPDVRLRHRSAAFRLDYSLDDHGPGVGLLTCGVGDGARSRVGARICKRVEDALSTCRTAIAEDPQERRGGRTGEVVVRRREQRELKALSRFASAEAARATGDRSIESDKGCLRVQCRAGASTWRWRGRWWR